VAVAKVGGRDIRDNLPEINILRHGISFGAMRTELPA
jgi:hypothetical protein